MKIAEPRIAARRRSKLPNAAMKPSAEKPRLAVPTSNWNGLSAQPMNAAAISPKKMWNTAL